MEESSTNKKNIKKSRANDEDSKKNNQNNNENINEFLKEENKKALFDKLINNFSENFLLEQKLTISRQNQIPYFKFNDKPISMNEESKELKKNNERKKEEEDNETIKIEDTKEITFGNDIIYGLALLSHYVIAVKLSFE